MSLAPILVLVLGMLLFMILGLPLAFSIFGISTLTAVIFTDISLWQLIQRFFAGVDSFVLTAIPFFLLTEPVDYKRTGEYRQHFAQFL